MNSETVDKIIFVAVLISAIAIRVTIAYFADYGAIPGVTRI